MRPSKLSVFLIAFALVTLAPLQAIASGTVVKSIRNVYSTSNVTTSAYRTLIAATASPISHMNLGDSSTQALAISWAATCGALANTANSVFIWPSTANYESVMDVDFAIPTGMCVGIEALSGTASSGELDVNFLR